MPQQFSNSLRISVTFATTYALALEKKMNWLTKKQGNLPFGVAMWIAFTW